MNKFGRSKTYFSFDDSNSIKSVQSPEKLQQGCPLFYNSKLQMQSPIRKSEDETLKVNRTAQKRNSLENEIQKKKKMIQQIEQQQEEDVFSFNGTEKSLQTLNERASGQTRMSSKKISKFDSLLMKHYDQKNQEEIERVKKKERQDLNKKFSELSLNVKASPFESKRTQERSKKARNQNGYMIPQIQREPLRQIKRYTNNFKNSNANIPINAMNHPFAQKQFHHCLNQDYNHNINSNPNQPPLSIHSTYQNSQQIQNDFNDQDKENSFQPQFIPASYQRPQYSPCYLIPVPQQQNIPVFSHALYPYPLALSQPFIYSQQTIPPPPPGFNIPLQNQQQYFFLNPPPPVPFNSHFTSQSSFPQHQNVYQAEQNQYNEVQDQQLPQFIDPNSGKAWENDKTATDDFSQSSFTPTTFSRDYIKKRLDFNSPLSIMSFKKIDSPEYRSSKPKSNKVSSQVKSRQKKQHMNSDFQKYSSLSKTVTPQKKKNNQYTLQLPNSDSKYDKKKWFGERVNNIFDRVDQLQQSMFKEMNKECLSAEKAMKCMDKQLKIQK